MEAELLLPRFGGHPGRREPAPGATDGKSICKEAAFIHDGLQGGNGPALRSGRSNRRPGREGSGPDGNSRPRVCAAGGGRRRRETRAARQSERQSQEGTSLVTTDQIPHPVFFGRGRRSSCHVLTNRILPSGLIRCGSARSRIRRRDGDRSSGESGVRQARALDPAPQTPPTARGLPGGRPGTARVRFRRPHSRGRHAGRLAHGSSTFGSQGKNGLVTRR